MRRLMRINPFRRAKEPDFAWMRAEMIVRQLVGRGIHSSAVLNAMQSVPREKFVPEHLAEAAYDDCALGIGESQTISQPYMVAAMAEAANLSPGDKVLEIGTGSGYAAAVLSKLVEGGTVYTVERVQSLYDRSRERLKDLGYSNVVCLLGDGVTAAAPYEPFDAVIVAAAAIRPPAELFEQLKPTGRLVMPVGPPSGQVLAVWTMEGGQWRPKKLFECAFVPLVSDISLLPKETSE